MVVREGCLCSASAGDAHFDQIRLIEQGANIKAISRLAGHASIVTTAIYVEDNPDRLKRLTNLAFFLM